MGVSTCGSNPVAENLHIQHLEIFCYPLTIWRDGASTSEGSPLRPDHFHPKEKSNVRQTWNRSNRLPHGRPREAILPDTPIRRIHVVRCRRSRAFCRAHAPPSVRRDRAPSARAHPHSFRRKEVINLDRSE